MHVATSVTTQVERLSCDDSSAPMTAAEYGQCPGGATRANWRRTAAADGAVSIVAGA